VKSKCKSVDFSNGRLLHEMNYCEWLKVRSCP